ncbi:arsenate reductase family protein [Vampirovibrio sp.]|uniref:arsenate reductase family protein n=1 Tax=Vampirovibrio sp. TaxID=2717857 RepID=UPI00359480AB
MTLRFYGKKNCVTCQKAKAFLESQNVAFEELPIETQPPTAEILARLVDEANVKASLNSRSAIYKAKNLGQNLPDKSTALQLMLTDPNLIKRPVIMNDQGALYQGFDEASLKAFLRQS